MARTLRRMLLVVATATSIPTGVFAQPAAPSHAPAADPPADNLSAQDREAVAAAVQLATDASQTMESWISTQAVSEGRLFSRFYFPIAKSYPLKYSTAYDTLADRDLVGVEDKTLTRSPTFLYAIVTDTNGYVPAHNSRFAQPLSGNMAQDYVNNRTKQIFGDTASLKAARSEASYLLQRTKLETGDVIYDVSVPVMVRGKRWGCARIGYRRTE